MDLITLNRVMVALVLIYFPLGTLGETGSYWKAFTTFAFLLAVMVIGAIEQAEHFKRDTTSPKD